MNHLRQQWRRRIEASDEPKPWDRSRFRTLCQTCADKLGANPTPPSFDGDCSECERFTRCFECAMPLPPRED